MAPLADSPGPTAPMLDRGGNPGAKRARLTCDVAFRTPSGKYKVKTIRLPMPPPVDDLDAVTGLLAYRGWDPSVPDPVRLAACEIPNTTEAIAWTADHLGGKRSPEALRPLRGNGRDAIITAADPQVTVPTIATIDAVTTQVADCSDCLIHENDYIGPEPSSESDPALVIAPSSDLALQQPAIYCTGTTDNAHLSNTSGFLGRINVHGVTTCSSPILITTWATLQRRTCTLWIFCSWSTFITGERFSGTTNFKRVVANTECFSGYWRGRTYHHLSYPPGYYPATGQGWSTSPYISRITCGTTL